MKSLIDIDFILASSSPRRISFLKNLGLKFEIVPSNIEEVKKDNSNPEELSIENAYNKAISVAKKYRGKYVAGFDTIVVIDNQILGKPINKKEAFRMLKLLSNNKHYVITGFTIVNLNKNIEIKKAVITEVWFKNLTSYEIEWYISTNEPFDKAGGYAIQGKGSFMVEKINGSYSNVVGLPLAEFIEVLRGLK